MGEKVKCIKSEDSGGLLTTGGLYTVEFVFGNHISLREIKVNFSSNFTGNWMMNRFRKLNLMDHVEKVLNENKI